jgi:hypothetical protein
VEVRVPRVVATPDSHAPAPQRGTALDRGVLVVAPRGRGFGAHVLVDGHPLGAAPLFVRLAPGKHRLTLLGEGRAVAPAETTVVVAVGRTTTVVFRIPELVPGPTGAATHRPRPVPPPGVVSTVPVGTGRDTTRARRP